MMSRLRSTWISYAFFVAVPMILIIAALVTGWDLSVRGMYDLPRWALLSAGSVFMFVVMPLLQMFQIWEARRSNPKIFGIRTQSFTPEGFSASSDGFNTSFKWDAIPKAIETKDFFLIYISSRSAHITPKPRLTEPGDLEKLRAVLKNYLNERAQLFSPA